MQIKRDQIRTEEEWFRSLWMLEVYYVYFVICIIKLLNFYETIALGVLLLKFHGHYFHTKKTWWIEKKIMTERDNFQLKLKVLCLFKWIMDNYLTKSNTLLNINIVDILRSNRPSAWTQSGHIIAICAWTVKSDSTAAPYVSVLSLQNFNTNMYLSIFQNIFTLFIFEFCSTLCELYSWLCIHEFGVCASVFEIISYSAFI